MKKFDFYFYLNLFNLLLVIFMFGMFLVFFITCYISQNWILPICFILLYLLAKIFILYLLFVIFVKIFPNSELIRVAVELKTDPTLRKNSILLAFSYDAIIMLCFALRDIIEYRFEWGISSCVWDTNIWWSMDVLRSIIYNLENSRQIKSITYSENICVEKIQINLKCLIYQSNRVKLWKTS